jgi:hypothetical protein
MKNSEFYKFCKNNRETAETLAKRQAFISVYNYMRECGTSFKGIKEYINHQIKQSDERILDIDAYQWILEVLEGPSQVISAEEEAGQLLLFPQEG